MEATSKRLTADKKYFKIIFNKYIDFVSLIILFRFVSDIL